MDAWTMSSLAPSLHSTKSLPPAPSLSFAQPTPSLSTSQPWSHVSLSVALNPTGASAPLLAAAQEPQPAPGFPPFAGALPGTTFRFGAPLPQQPSAATTQAQWTLLLPAPLQPQRRSEPQTNALKQPPPQQTGPYSDHGQGEAAFFATRPPFPDASASAPRAGMTPADVAVPLEPMQQPFPLRMPLPSHEQACHSIPPKASASAQPGSTPASGALTLHLLPSLSQGAGQQPGTTPATSSLPSPAKEEADDCSQPLEASFSGRCAFGIHRKKQGLDRKDLPEDGYSWHKYGHKTLMGLFSRAYYRCTHRSNGCRAKKTVDTALKGSSEVRITYDGTHNHAAERSVLEGVVVPSKSRSPGPEGNFLTDEVATGGGDGAVPTSLVPFRKRAQEPAFTIALHSDGGSAPFPSGLPGSSSVGAPTVEIRHRKQRRVVVVAETSSASATRLAVPGRVGQPEILHKYVVVEGEGDFCQPDSTYLHQMAPGERRHHMMTSMSGNSQRGAKLTWEDGAAGGQASSPRSDSSAVIEQAMPPEYLGLHKSHRREDGNEASSIGLPNLSGIDNIKLPPRGKIQPLRHHGDEGASLDLELRL